MGVYLFFDLLLYYLLLLNRDTQVSEYSLELLLLQVIMPCLLEQNHARQWLLYGLRTWCLAVSWLLGLRSYLLGDVASSTEVSRFLGSPNTVNSILIFADWRKASSSQRSRRCSG